ncbi:MAG: hypothetical protein JWM68_3382 [Verrucomicrobiales bacterium]|nr:hypothetical protein [Verrucomicrobiales bacterium]
MAGRERGPLRAAGESQRLRPANNTAQRTAWDTRTYQISGSFLSESDLHRFWAGSDRRHWVTVLVSGRHMSATPSNQNKMRYVLFLALFMVAFSSMWSGPLLTRVYRSMYSVEFGPKYVQVVGQVRQ